MQKQNFIDKLYEKNSKRDIVNTSSNNEIKIFFR